MTPNMRVVKRSVDKIDLIKEVLLEFVPKAFPLGKEVHWSHGKYTRSGIVDMHSDYIHRCKDIRVRLRSGSTKWICVTQLHEYPD